MMTSIRIKINLILYEDEVHEQHESFKLKPLSVQGMSQKITYTNAFRIMIFCIVTFFSVCLQDRLLELYMFVSMCVCMYQKQTSYICKNPPSNSLSQWVAMSY